MSNHRRRHNFLGQLLAAVAVICAGGAGRAAGQIDEAQFTRDFKAIAASQTRVIGSPGYDQTADYLRAQIQGLTNVELREQTYPVIVPVTHRSDITLADGTTAAVYPFWPAGVRVNSTPLAGITGRLVYCGRASYEELRPADLRGQIAVVEADNRGRWPQVFYFGARAVLILGSDDTGHQDLADQELLIPIDLPRFYVPPGEFADRLRQGAVAGDATLRVQVSWERRTARNFYALVKPPALAALDAMPLSAQWALGRTLTPGPAGWTSNAAPAALMFAVPFDSTSLVPDLAPGASQAVQTAAALALLRDLARTPLQRPVVVFFSGAEGIQFLGTRQMFMALSDVPGMWRENLADPDTGLDLLEQALHQDLQRALDLQGDPRRLEAARDRRLIERITKIIQLDAATELDELFHLRTLPEAQRTPEVLQHEQMLDRAQARYSALVYQMGKNPDQLSDVPEAGADRSFLDLARGYLARAIVRMDGDADHPGLVQQFAQRRRQIEDRIDLYHWLAGRLHRDPEPDRHANTSRLIELMVGLDFSDGGVRAGPLCWSNINNIQDYRDWFSKSGADVIARQGGLVDVEPLTGAQPSSSFLDAAVPLGTQISGQFGVPGFSMVTLDDLRLRRDTPLDSADRVNLGVILPQLRAVRDVFWAAWNDPKFKGLPEIRWDHGAFEGQVVSRAPGQPVPDLPRAGFLAACIAGWDPSTGIPVLDDSRLQYAPGVRRTELSDCDAEGRYFFEGLPRSGFVIEAYRVGTDGAINAISDLGTQGGTLSLSVNLAYEPSPVRSLVFDCTEFPLVELYDPRFLQPLPTVDLIDARRNAEPQRFNIMLHREMATAFVEPDERLEMALRYGSLGYRMLLLNAADPGTVADIKSAQDAVRLASRGFTIDQLRHIEPLALVSARDFFRIDSMRLDRYRRVGVQIALADELHDRAATELEAAGNDLAQNQAAAFVKDSNGAWAEEARVHEAAMSMGDDVVRAAIFLLLLCMPFAFCMERLVIATANIYRQISWVAGIFAIMAGALWSFHPAFQISFTPLIIILAFAIMFMSAMVIGVIYGKFSTELKRIRSGRGSVAATSFARVSVLSSAVMLGIANMRRRKFRTALTSITVILITFAVLCFTSSTRYLDVSEMSTGEAFTQHGLMLRERGWRGMPPAAADQLQAVLGPRQIVRAWWNVSPIDSHQTYHLVTRAPGQAPDVYSCQAILGLTPGAAQMSRIADVIGPQKYDRLEKGEQNIIYMCSQIAAQLKVREGDQVELGGMKLEVAGIFDAAAFDQDVNMLSGEPVAPLKYASGMLDAGGRSIENFTQQEGLDMDVQSSAAELGSSLYEHLAATEFVIVPAAVSRMLPGATLRVMEVKLDSDQEVRDVGNDLAQRFAVAIFAGRDSGVQMLASTTGFPKVSGAADVAIPLAIAGLIIFNTMMGSIAERRREIHVYTSLGLAPMHVGALFVAEAMTYGLIGTVFGYIIGQGLGTALLKLGWLGNVTLNYSGSSAMLTMGLILVIVLLSALVPARLASQIAAPSIERTWKVPIPKGDEIIADLPFTINKTAADGALAYLAEYFDAHQEGSIGKFSADKIEAFTIPDVAHGMSRGLKTVVWLTPFDLGVRQHLMLLIHPGQYEDIYEVQLVLQRLSGDDRSWYRMNRTFLTEMRKQFLQWRSLTPQRMLEYVEDSKRLFV